MKITFLGTGTSLGVPMLTSKHKVCLSSNFKDKRLRSSLLISDEDKNYVVDCGADFRQQMLRENVQNVNGILFTHEHADHTAGFDDIRPYCFQIGAMPIYTISRVMLNLKRRFDYIFTTENRYPSAPKVLPNIIDTTPFYLEDIKVIPVEVLHGTLPIVGYRFNNVAYLTDAKQISEKEQEKLTDLDVLIVNALRKEEHPTHFNLSEALSFIKKLKPKKAYLTHISYKLGFHDEVEKQLPENVFLAYDGLQIEL